MTLQTGDPIDLPIEPLTEGVSVEGKTITISAPDGFGAAALRGVPPNVSLSLRVHPEPNASYFGLCVKGAGRYQEGCELRFEPSRERVQFGRPKDGGMGDDTRHAITHVKGLDGSFVLDVVVKDDIVDVCIDNRRTIIQRHRGVGDCIFFFAQDAEVRFEPLLELGECRISNKEFGTPK
jgi:hypothetical protein